ncbi:phospholipase D-like domain-containing protein [Clostridium sp. B9]|uniref:phospholipase D-like domain-containing protein n=1 Tax=Clostridium sp. B9 TaxID=3423224 RepID=UPI003D2F4DB4
MSTVYYSNSDFNKLINILIYNLVRIDDTENVVVVFPDEKIKCLVLSLLEDRDLIIGKNIRYILEDNIYKDSYEEKTYIFMFADKFKNYNEVIRYISLDDTKIKVIGTVIDIEPTHENIYNQKMKYIIKYREKWDKVKYLKKDNIKLWLLDSINIAQDIIYLECPWFNENAFNYYKNAIIRALNRGVEVRINFGIKSNSDDKRYKKTKNLMLKLEYELNKYEKFSVHEVNTHKKIAIIDRFYLIGSYNYASNSMDYEDCPEEESTVNILSRKELIEKCKEF